MILPRACFVAGTDTGVGKTRTTCGMLTALASQGRMCAGIKPVAAGASLVDGILRNEDALALAAAGNQPGLHLDDLNPVLLPDPISPHLAARHHGVELQAVEIAAQVARVLAGPADHYLVEGSGGWLAPISDRETMADIAVHLGLPVILVVGLRLGCLSHALLTAEAIRHAGLDLVAWVANELDPEMASLQENLETLAARLPGRHLGLIPWKRGAEMSDVVASLRLNG